MLLSTLGILYITNVALETVDIAIVVLLSTVALSHMTYSTRGSYYVNLFLESVWLLSPTLVCMLLITRVVLMHTAAEELQ